MRNKQHIYTVTVSEQVIDTLNHVNNVEYLNFVQDAAEKHWSILSTREIDEKFVWVVLRHEIDYKKAAKLNDLLEIKTWIGESSGVKSERFVEIRKDNALIAKAKTIWWLFFKSGYAAGIKNVAKTARYSPANHRFN